MRIQRPRLSVRITAVFLAVALAALLLEAMSRLVFTYQDELSGNSILSLLVRGEMVMDPYEMESPSIGGHWVLRPGYPFSNDSKNQNHINQYGMRGPDIDEDHSRLRILSLGDSVTFGVSKTAYPRIIEDTLNEAGFPAEVINAGVEGYAPRNLLYEINRYASLRPEVVTIFIGWNALYSPSLWLEKSEQTVRTLWFVRNIGRNLYRQFKGEKAYAREMLARTPRPDAQSEDVMYAENYIPPFLEQIEKLIDRFEAKGSSVFLLTLPGLFVSDEKPTMKAIKKGHLPAFSVNSFVLAKITERYNKSLRDLAARRGLGLIDLAAWSDQNLSPREDFFSDSVHLTSEGLRRVGVFIAEELKSSIGKEPAQ
ncbi:MAG: SGNH/GDSL hydrolase family protein [Rhodospirillales bacterium]|nr:SGNH/GDSL hydrolase family protein [Rhodospirillales bacterium]